MRSHQIREWARARWAAFTTWSAPVRQRAVTVVRAAGERAKSAPWRKIGIWTGGVFGVLITTLALFVTFADWNALRGPIARRASAASGREIAIRGDLDVNPWSWTPELRVSGLYIGNPARFRERGAFAEVRETEAAVRLLPLFIGRFEFVRLDLNGADIRLYRDAEGVSNWAGSESRQGRQLRLPAIKRFALREGRVRLEDAGRNLVLDAEFTTEETLDARNPGRFALSGEGSINRRPFEITLAGAPLINVRRDRPYEFEARIRAGATRVSAQGAIAKPFDFNRWGADIEASGADLADLYDLIGLALPNTPPYDLRGRLEREGRQFGMPRLSGRVGDSDIAGRWTATNQRNGRLMLEGAFRSNSLDFDDLMAVLGGAPSTERGETVSAEQRRVAAALAAQGRLLPDATLDIRRVRNMDARVSFNAARVRARNLPLRGLAMTIGLDNGLLTIDPMVLRLTRGRISGSASINAREDVPVASLDVRIADARLEQIVVMQNGQPITGALQGRARLTGRGASVRDAAAAADGEITLVIPSGEVREAFAELTGINVSRGLGLLLTDDQSKVDIRCGVASFRVRNGVASAQSFVVDTENVLIRGGGGVNLRNETLDLRLEGEAKEPRLLSVAAPVTLRGRLRAPQIGVDADEAIGQGGLAAVLATIAAPLAAVLPFVDPGLAEDANCGALLAGRESARL